MLAQVGREAEAMRQFRRALEAEPDHPTALGILTFNAITTGDEAEARRWMEQVRNQPRMQRSQIDPLVDAFRKQFGRSPW
jgi:Tfp pilus assembly protein PilF